MVVFGLKDITVRGIPAVSETPSFRYIKNEGPYPRDIERYGSFWVISKKLKNILLEFKSEAFDFLECEMHVGGEVIIGEYWFCDVVRVVDAIDEANSEIGINYVAGGKQYSYFGFEKISLKMNEIQHHRIFMVKHCWPRVMCDETLAKACKSEKIKNIFFEEVQF